MRLFKILVYSALAGMLVAQQSPRVTVRELPPEPIPKGSCKDGHSGYLGVEGTKSSRFDVSEQEIGEYVVTQIRQGYSLTLYPQASGRIFRDCLLEAMV
jgi:hypothetical protein